MASEHTLSCSSPILAVHTRLGNTPNEVCLQDFIDRSADIKPKHEVSCVDYHQLFGVSANELDHLVKVQQELKRVGYVKYKYMTMRLGTLADANTDMELTPNLLAKLNGLDRSPSHLRKNLERIALEYNNKALVSTWASAVNSSNVEFCKTFDTTFIKLLLPTVSTIKPRQNLTLVEDFKDIDFWAKHAVPVCYEDAANFVQRHFGVYTNEPYNFLEHVAAYSPEDFIGDTSLRTASVYSILSTNAIIQRNQHDYSSFLFSKLNVLA